MRYPHFEATPYHQIKGLRLGVGVIILNGQGQILLEKRADNGLWGLPGGKMEIGESVRQAALREVAEETGLEIEIISLLGVYSEPEQRIANFPDNVVQLVDVVVVAEVLSGTLNVSHESETLSFFDRNQLPSAIVPPAQRPLADFVAQKLGIIA